MNYLAHAYLSFNQPEILLGNMSSDFIKGKKKFDYSSNIQKGITLHRAIDTFTDAHEATAAAKQFFKASVGLYAGAFVDVVYDHFLALDKNEFPQNEALQAFAANTYKTLQNNVMFLPHKLQLLLPYMQQQNWLYNYQFLNGIEKSFEGVARRAVYLSSWQEPFTAFKENYSQLQSCYNTFFPQIKSFAFNQMQTLVNA